jgi:hypothetical protein
LEPERLLCLAGKKRRNKRGKAKKEGKKKPTVKAELTEPQGVWRFPRFVICQLWRWGRLGMLAHSFRIKSLEH